MKPAFADLPRTEDGMVIWGNPNDTGCPHCGEVDVKISKHNDAVLYHAAVHCCEPRLREQIRIRQAEGAALHQERETRRQAAQEVQDKNPRDIQTADAAWRAFNQWNDASRELESEIVDDLNAARVRLNIILGRVTTDTARQPYRDQA